MDDREQVSMALGRVAADTVTWCHAIEEGHPPAVRREIRLMLTATILAGLCVQLEDDEDVMELIKAVNVMRTQIQRSRAESN